LPARFIAALYYKRWGELDLRNIKTRPGMEHLCCGTPEMAIKELWVYLIAYNLIRLPIAQAALLDDQIPHQLSFKHTLQICWPGSNAATPPMMWFPSTPSCF